MSLPVSTLCVGVLTMDELKAEIAIARSFKPMSDADKEQLLSIAAPEAGDGRHELFKSTQNFDGAHHRRQHEFSV